MSPIETVIQDYFAAIRRRDAEAWIACFAPEAEVRDPADTPPRIGAEAHLAFFNGFAGLFAELNFHPDRIFPRGNRAAVYFRARCVTRGGRTVELDGIDLFELDEAGRVLRLTGWWDPAPLLAAAGT